MRRRCDVIRRLIAACFCAAALAAASAALAAPTWDVPAEVSQGRVFAITVRDSAPFESVMEWNGKSFPLAGKPSSTPDVWEASLLLGVPMDARGAWPLTAHIGRDKLSASIRVLPVAWSEQKLSVLPEYVTPPAEVQAQIARDAERSKKVIQSFRPEQDWTLPFARPVPGGVSSAFGGRRIFNGEPRSPHRGTDMRGPAGTPVKAVAAGVVALAEPQYFSGNVIYIDHGQGVISLYAHLSAFEVQPGDIVRRGQVIGKVGATGRVTGPHLHLGMMVQGVAVDAMPLYTSPLKPVGGPTPEDRPQPPAQPQGKGQGTS